MSALSDHVFMAIMEGVTTRQPGRARDRFIESMMGAPIEDQLRHIAGVLYDVATKAEGLNQKAVYLEDTVERLQDQSLENRQEALREHQVMMEKLTSFMAEMRAGRDKAQNDKYAGLCGELECMLLR